MSDEGSSWASWFLLCLLVGVLVGVGDCRFSIPAHKPFKQKSEILSQNMKRYFIIYDEDFVGSAVFNPDQKIVDFEITNTSKDPYSFKEAECYLWTIKHVGYGLEITALENSSWENGSLIFNPQDTVAIRATMPRRIFALEEVEGFIIKQKGLLGRKIRFGYERLGWWDRLRWLVAEQIRQD